MPALLTVEDAFEISPACEFVWTLCLDVPKSEVPPGTEISEPEDAAHGVRTPRLSPQVFGSRRRAGQGLAAKLRERLRVRRNRSGLLRDRLGGLQRVSGEALSEGARDVVRPVLPP